MNTISQKLWEMPELSQINRLPAHSCLIPHADVASASRAEGRNAINGGQVQSSRLLSLDGEWDFALFADPEAATLAIQSLAAGAARSAPTAKRYDPHAPKRWMQPKC